MERTEFGIRFSSAPNRVQRYGKFLTYANKYADLGKFRPEQADIGRRTGILCRESRQGEAD